MINKLKAKDSIPEHMYNDIEKYDLSQSLQEIANNFCSSFMYGQQASYVIEVALRVNHFHPAFSDSLRTLLPF